MRGNLWRLLANAILSLVRGDPMFREQTIVAAFGRTGKLLYPLKFLALAATHLAAEITASRPNWNWNRSMNSTAKFLSVFAALAATTAWAAEPKPHATHHPAPAAKVAAAKPGASMMGGDKMGMADMHGLGMSAGRLASLKRELALTSAQLPLWDAFADAAQAMSGRMAMHPEMEMPMGKPMMPEASMSPGMAMPKSGMAMMEGPGTLPERLDRHEAMMTDRLEALRKVKAALLPLYAALSPVQRVKLDAMPTHPRGQ